MTVRVRLLDLTAGGGTGQGPSCHALLFARLQLGRLPPAMTELCKDCGAELGDWAPRLGGAVFACVPGNRTFRLTLLFLSDGSPSLSPAPSQPLPFPFTAHSPNKFLAQLIPSCHQLLR